MDRDALSIHFVESSLFVLRFQKGLGEKAIAQLADEDLARASHPDMNSVAVIVKHLHGNMLSRWTNWLEEDGEKDWRDRDGEFSEPGAMTRQELLELWDKGWACVFNALESLSAEQVAEAKTVIRGREHSIIEAVQRQIGHYSYHIGQIVLIARLFKGGDWQTLSIARNESRQYKPGEKY